MAGAVTYAGAGSAAGAGTPIRWVFIGSGQKSPMLVGMPLSRAVDVANRYHLRLKVLRVVEDATRTTVTQEPRGLPGPLLRVVSAGPTRNLRAVLPRAKGLPSSRSVRPASWWTSTATAD